MINVSSIASGAYQLLGRPAQLDMPYQDVVAHTADVVRGRLLDLKLAAKGHTIDPGTWSTPSDREMSSVAFTGGIDNFIPVKVEWRYLGTDTTLVPNIAEVVAYERLSDLAASAKSYVAFYNGFGSIAFNDTQAILSQREYRVAHENLDDVSVALGGNVEFPPLFISLMKYEVALRCLDQVQNESEKWAERRERLRPSLLTIFTQDAQRFDQWRRTRYGNKIVKKRGLEVRR